MSRVLPKWVTSLKPLTGVAGFLSDFGSDPVGWFRRRAARFILGGLFGLVLSLAGIIRSAWTTVSDAFGGAGAELWNTIGDAIGGILIAPVAGVNDWVFHLVLGDSLGGLEAPVVALLYLVEFTVVIRLAKPGLLAAGEAVSGIPVLGAVVNGGIVFLVEFQERMTGTAQRLYGGIA